MDIFSGKLYGTDVVITYSNKNIVITKYAGDRVERIGYRERPARRYLNVILLNLTLAIKDTLSEMNSSKVIEVGCIRIDKNNVDGVVLVHFTNILDIISELVDYYSDYFIKPSLLIDGGITSGMYSDVKVKKYMGIIYNNIKYIIEKVYLIPKSKNNIVKFYFQHFMVMMSTAELVEGCDKAAALGDNIEENKLEVGLFGG